ncbi:tripartite tricarboxylate transporter substrate binding protein [Ferrovibrio sp.]|uniref:Bug family tripartite tricarboxylate transporter substrate binding protein n=1 Tax=Ferrovibrio sp. TaxID=1917215 RepID=UPI0025C39E9E|nr:tripartite tricarboxylate transporter substrate binding protein [Ferrovibrio sp.]MBX3453727.1 tripartite tricarboxylate transporter substrate binding protein [Ferrovibrio sp.]
MSKTMLALALGAVFALTAGTGQAQNDWPNKPITMIVPYPAGGFADSVTRAASAEAAQILKQPIVVDNKPGAAGRIGTDAITRAAPDGYTIGIAVPATLSLLPLIDKRYENLSKQYTPITIAVRTYSALAVNPDKVSAKTFKEFAALVKQKQLSYGSAGIGTSYHLWVESILNQLGAEAVHVPYRGEAPGVADLVAGHVDFMMISGASKSLMESGKLRVLATTGPVRWSVYPDVPTLKEAGLDQFSAIGWLSFIAPPGLPKPLQDKLNAAYVQALKSEAVSKMTVSQGYELVASPPEALPQTVAEDMKLFAPIFASGRVKLE